MILTLFESVQKAYTRPDLVINGTWEEIAVLLTTFNHCNRKEDMLLFNLWEFDPQGEPGRKYKYENQERTEKYEEIPNTIRRCKANAEGVWGIVLDFDGSRRIDDIKDEFSELEFILYTTFRHTDKQNKFRVVLPFNRLATRKEIRAKNKSIAETFQEVDHASFSESQSFYLHSGTDEKNAHAYYNSGLFLDPDWFEDEVIPPRVEKPATSFDGDTTQYKEDLKKSLLSCSGMHYAGIGTQHGVLTLVALCKSSGISYEEFDYICAKISASDSSLQGQPQRKQAWAGWTPFNGITAKVREEFITAYGGKSVFGQNRLPMTTEQLREYIRNKYGDGK